jgi:integrase/recombinase XerD
MFAFTGSGKALFLANNGKRYVPDKLANMASQYVKSAGFDHTGAFHLYLHNTATTMLDNGVNFRHIQEMLGYVNILTTQLYTHVSHKKHTDVFEGRILQHKGEVDCFNILKLYLLSLIMAVFLIHIF